MIVEENSNKVLASGVGAESFFNVKQENLAHVFSILRNQLYSNKELAIIREYCTNAYDAHVEAGIADTPIQIAMPTYFNPTLSIRDFGFGLSEDDVFNVFASYGESTKRNTNSQVGMMGLGSKSAFCYSDSFTVISYFNGEKKTYSAYIDDSGIGKISVLNIEDANETGLEIQIPVQKYGITRFNDEMISFMKDFKPRPVILNNNQINSELDSYDPNIFLSGNGWDIRRSSYSTKYFCIMGNVKYPIDINNLDFTYEESEGFRRISGIIVIHANIGDVKPSASRELLNYTSNTKEFLRKRLDALFNELKETSIAKIANSKTYFEAKINFSNLHHYIPSAERNINWNGKIVNCGFIILESPIVIFRKFNDSKWAIDTILNPKENTTIFIYKGDVARKSIFVRAQSYMHDNSVDNKNVYLLGFDNPNTANSWLAEGYLDGATIVDVASIPYVFRKKDRIKTEYEKAEVYSFNSREYSRNKDYWTAENSDVLEEEECVYIPIKYFAPVDCKINKECCENPLHELSKFLNKLHCYGITAPKIYGIQQKNIKDLNGSWMHFDDYVQSSLDALSFEHRKNIIYTSNMRALDDFWLKLANELGENDADGLYELAKEWQNRKIVDGAGIMYLVQFGFEFDMSSIRPLNQKCKEMIAKYPLLDIPSLRNRIDLLGEIVKYIKAS